MATSFGALCDDFYINQTIAMQMDLPSERDTLLHFLDRVRADQPSMTKFNRYSDELALESPRRDGAYRWLALRARNLSSGHVNADSLDQIDELHELVLKLAPYNLSLSSLDIEYQEVLFGFDLEAEANQNQIVYDALFADTPLGPLLDIPGAKAMDIQPLIGISLNDKCDLQAFFEVRTSTSEGQIRRDRFRNEPISILMTVRRVGPIEKPEDLLTNYTMLRETAEKLASEHVIPHVLQPITRAMPST